MRGPRLIGILVAIAAGVATLVWLRGCGASIPKGATGQLVLANEARASWRIGIAPLGGGEPRVLRVPARGEVTVELSPGQYLLSQTLLDIHGDALSNRQVRFAMSEGKRYQWRLLTLLSEPALRSGGER